MSESPLSAPREAPAAPETAADAPPPSAPEAAPLDHAFSDRVAALTETPLEAEIDARMGLRGASGHQPAPEDFDDILSPEGDSKGVFGADVVDSVLPTVDDGSANVPDRGTPR